MGDLLDPEKGMNTIAIPELRDQNDVKILSTAISSEAEFLITGDLDLLVLNPFSSMKIMTPSDFYRSIVMSM